MKLKILTAWRFVLLNRVLRMLLPGREPATPWLHDGRIIWLSDDRRSNTPGIVYGEVQNGFYDPPLPLRDGDVVLDLGAHVGGYAIPMALRYPGVRFICLEPNPRNHANLVKNAARQNGGFGLPNVTVINGGIWGKGNVSLVSTHPRFNTGGSHTVEATKGTKSYTLDDLRQQFGLQSIRLMKIDVEGAEFKAIREPGDLHGIESILAEVHGTPERDTDGMVQMLSKVPHRIQVLGPAENQCKHIENGRPWVPGHFDQKRVTG